MRRLRGGHYTPAVSHRKAAELRRGKHPADVGIGPGNPLFIMSSVYNPLPLSPLLMWMCACDLCHLCPLLLHVPVFPHPPSTTGTTKETAFESSTLRYLNHLPHPLQTPISSCGCTSKPPFQAASTPIRHLVGFLIGRTVHKSPKFAKFIPSRAEKLGREKPRGHFANHVESQGKPRGSFYSPRPGHTQRQC